MKQLNLNAFKAKMSNEETQKVENLIGGILGDCHTLTYEVEDPCTGECVIFIG